MSLLRPFNKHFARRHLSTSSVLWSNLTSEVDSSTGIATITLQKKPANTLNLEFTREIIEAVKGVEANNSVSGMILTSGLGDKNIFSAGLELSEMANIDEVRCRKFWDGFRVIIQYVLQSVAQISAQFHCNIQVQIMLSHMKTPLIRADWL